LRHPHRQLNRVQALQTQRHSKTVTRFIQRRWLHLSAILLACITALSLHPLNTLPEVPGSDKTHHFVAYAALAFPTALRKPRRWPLIIFGFALYSGLIELIQPHVNRYGEWEDFLANACGLLLGVGLAFCINRLERHHSIP